MVQLNIDASLRPNQFEVLRKWCTWTTSPKIIPVPSEGEDPPVSEQPPYVVNAVMFVVLVDFLLNGVSVTDKPVEVHFKRSIVGGDQALWNQKMDKAESLTTAQIAAMPKVMDELKKIGKTL